MKTQRSTLRSWLPVISLAFAAFVFCTSEFAPVGLLSDIAKSFDMRVADTGLMLTIYAWVVALVSLPFTIVFSHTNRRHLLLGVIGLFVVSHVLSTVAWSFNVLIISRLGVATSHAIFWAITAALAMRVAPEGHKTQAISMIVVGTSLATILGLPLGRVIGEFFSWRITFLIIGAIAAMVWIIVYRMIPQLPAANAGSLKSLPDLMRRPALMGLYVLVAVIITAHFTAYTYIEPLVQQVMNFSNHFATMILFVFGIAGLGGSLLFGTISARYPLAILFGAVGVISVCMLALMPLAGNSMGVIIVCAIWGIGITFIGLATQLRTLELASDATDVATSIYSSIFNVGIGGGALLGSKVILNSGLEHVSITGGVLGLLALAWGLLFCLHFMRKSAAHPSHSAV